MASNGVDFNGCARQGEWLDSTALAPGTYYIHFRKVRQSDYATAWSSVNAFTVRVTSPPPSTPAPTPAPTPMTAPAPAPEPNRLPRLSGKLLMCCEMITVRATVCDDDGPARNITFFVRQNIKGRWKSTKHRFPAPAGCERYEFSTPLSFASTVGLHTADVWVSDGDKWSIKVLRGKWRY